MKDNYYKLIDLVLKEYENFKDKANFTKQHWVEMFEYSIEIYKNSETYKRRVKNSKK